jgi:hypothetical protein
MLQGAIIPDDIREEIKNEQDESTEERKWDGICFDDGTGQNVIYIGDDGINFRQPPPGFAYQTLDNGDRRFFNRGISYLLLLLLLLLLF